MENTKYYEHHKALTRGYVKVGQIIKQPYKGRFGKGYKILEHNSDSTQYCWVTYWIEK